MPEENLPVLVLTLKHKHFLDVQSGKKSWEYRLYKDYWKVRLIGKRFRCVIVTDGKTRWSDVHKWLWFPWKGYQIQCICHDEFGDDPVTVFAIKLER